MRIGIPRALFYYQYFTLFKTFFEDLGAEVITSPPTNKEIFEAGCSRVVAEICLPVKIFCGHALFLKDCDFIFIPSIQSIGNKAYNCPKFIGLPDLVRAVFPSAPHILDPNIDINKKREFYLSVLQLGRTFTSNPLKIKRAFERALNAYRQQQKERGSPIPNSPSIALIGHPYLLYDEYLNHNLVKRIEEMGFTVLFPEMVSQEKLEETISRLVERKYWTFEDEIIGAGGYYLQSNVSGIISLFAFGCGPDSLMMDLLQRWARKIGKPYLALVLDQHTSQSNIFLRVEAFIDMVKRKKGEYSKPFYICRSKETKKIGVFGTPDLGNIAPAIKTISRKLNIPVVIPPFTKHTLSLGTRYSPEFVCFPFKALLGNLIECLEMGADTIFMITSLNACRLGYYAKVQEEILRDLGYKFNFLRLHSSNKGFFAVLKVIKAITNASWSQVISLYRLGIAKLKAMDDLQREVQKIRPVEINKGTADAIFKKAKEEIEKVDDLHSLRKVFEEYISKLRQVPKDNIVPLKVGLIGEIFAVIEPFCNLDIEAELGRMGAEVRRTRSSYFSEWANLGNFNILNKEKEKLKHFAYPYLKRDIGGHGLESVAEKVRLADEMDGLVHLAPFTCMPESIAQNIMLSIPKDIPVLTILCDEQLAKAGLLTRLEAFLDLLHQRRRSNKRLIL